MMRRTDFRGPWRRVPLLAVIVALAGCHGGGQADAWQAGQQRFRDQLALTAQAVNAGDLEAARSHLGDARAVAVDARQTRKVAGMGYLIDGAEALRSGNPRGASAAWSQIDDPRLAREVRHKARLIGVEVPMAPIQEEAMR